MGENVPILKNIPLMLPTLSHLESNIICLDFPADVKGNRAPTMQQIPIKNIIFYFSVISYDFREQLPEEIIVRSLLEPKFADVVQVDAKLL